jgi:hypothetical protein
MTPMAAPEPLRFHGLEINADEIVERDAGRRVVTIPRGSIRAIRLEYGIVAERPLLQALFGLAVAVPGFFLGFRLWWPMLATQRLPHVPRTLLAAPLLLVLLGGWAFQGAFRRGWFLRVEMENDARKLAIARGADRAALAAFIDRARSELGYDVSGALEP